MSAVELWSALLSRFRRVGVRVWPVVVVLALGLAATGRRGDLLRGRAARPAAPTGTTAADAFAAARADTDRDTILLGRISEAGPFADATGRPVRVVGLGADATRLRTGTSGATLRLLDPGSSARGLQIDGGAAAPALQIDDGAAASGSVVRRPRARPRRLRRALGRADRRAVARAGGGLRDGEHAPGVRARHRARHRRRRRDAGAARPRAARSPSPSPTRSCGASRAASSSAAARSRRPTRTSRRPPATRTSRRTRASPGPTTRGRCRARRSSTPAAPARCRTPSRTRTRSATCGSPTATATARCGATWARSSSSRRRRRRSRATRCPTRGRRRARPPATTRRAPRRRSGPAAGRSRSSATARWPASSRSRRGGWGRRSARATRSSPPARARATRPRRWSTCATPRPRSTSARAPRRSRRCSAATAGARDGAIVEADFRDPRGAALGSLQIGPVTAADRAGATNLLLRAVSGAIPPLTRIDRGHAALGAPGGELRRRVLRLGGARAAASRAPRRTTIPLGAGPPLRPFAGVTVVSRRAAVDRRRRARVRLACATRVVGRCTGSVTLTARLPKAGVRRIANRAVLDPPRPREATSRSRSRRPAAGRSRPSGGLRRARLHRRPRRAGADALVVGPRARRARGRVPEAAAEGRVICALEPPQISAGGRASSHARGSAPAGTRPG